MKYYKLFYKEGWDVILKSRDFPHGKGLQICRDTGKIALHKDGHFSAHHTCVDATNEEIAWLEASIKAGRAVEKPKIIETYQIF